MPPAVCDVNDTLNYTIMNPVMDLSESNIPGGHLIASLVYVSCLSSLKQIVKIFILFFKTLP